MNTAISEYIKYINTSQADRKDLFDEPRKVSLQISLHKIPNLIGAKTVFCKLPHSLHINDKKENPSICLIVKDVDPKDRDYEKTTRKYQSLVADQSLNSLISMIVPLKQLNLEFRHFEAKRKLCTSFDMFLADKCLHEILFNGSKLGKEFRKRRKMPVEIDVNSLTLKEDIQNVLYSTSIRLSGRGAIVDINTFLSTHTVEQALANISAVKAELIKHLPGGEANIKSMYLKSTDLLSVPVYLDTNPIEHVNEIKVANNMTPNKKKKANKLSVKRLAKRTIIEQKKNKKKEKQLKKKSQIIGSTEKDTEEKMDSSDVVKAKKTLNKIKKSVIVQ